ncbi:hypothetical protein [Pedobacter aquatilis]|uniref:hypothetical protein n=1 Tax=Pedobacter aquatilis TaxID=351343 RepID=UPI00292EC89D|nr:hypothetical protein [Pedobacter aquatilis]
MRKLLAKVNCIGANGCVRMDLKKDHPLFAIDGRRCAVESVGVRDYKCRVWIDGVKVYLTIDEIS